MEFDTDLHIHSCHSIGVSKNMNIPNLENGAVQKGIRLVGTGDATQPDWLTHLKRSLKEKDGVLVYEKCAFVITAEVEDQDSIHHVIIIPDFESADEFRKLLKPYSPNIDDEWGGRPRVNTSAEQIAGFVREIGGLIGPAHAFTPFKAIFRENKYSSLQECYKSEAGNIHFLELGLSADSETADAIPELHRVTYISSSDAHSPTPDKLGREFVRFAMEKPNFDELKLAILRKRGRKPTLNVGFNPRLGKYYLSFCSSCRRTLIIREGNQSPEFDELNIYIYCGNTDEELKLLKSINERKVYCPADGKKLRLGVRDRAFMLGDGKTNSPNHRPKYIHIPPLLDLITTALKVKSAKSKTAIKLYETLQKKCGVETQILINTPISEIQDINSNLAKTIKSYRNDDVSYIAGGGGRYGRLIAPWESVR